MGVLGWGEFLQHKLFPLRVWVPVPGTTRGSSVSVTMAEAETKAACPQAVKTPGLPGCQPSQSFF